MQKRKLKIAIFHLAFIYSGGGERLVLEEAIRLKKKGHKVDLYSPIIDRENCFPELQKQIKIKRLLPGILPKWYPDNALISILAACLLAPFFFHRFRKYDIYFGANQPGPWIAFILSKLNKKPYVIYLAQPTRLVHPRLIDQQVGLRLLFGFSTLNLLTLIFKPIISIFDATSIKNANITLANGTYAKGLLEEVYKIQVVNCPAGSNLQKSINKKVISNRFNSEVILGDLKIPKPFALITNRHFPHKKFEYALRAVKKIKSEKINLVITGQETDYTVELKNKFRKNKQIYFIGLLSEKQLYTIYKEAAIYLYPAPEEDFGMGIIEAMSHGVPVVAWGNAGPTGIITQGVDGFLAKPFEITDFSSKIETLLKEKILYEKIALMSQQKVSKQFTYNKHVNTINKILLDCVYSWEKRYKRVKVRSRRRKYSFYAARQNQVARDYSKY